MRLFIALQTALVAGTLSAAHADAQPSQQPPATWAAFTQTLRTYADSDGVVGASAMVVEGGRVTARVMLGQQDRAAGVRTDSATIYHWGSITKTLTAISILQLSDRGKLSLDDPITRYVPELRQLHDPFGGIDRITLRMLLSHSAGFRNGTWPYSQGRAWEPFEPTTWNQLVAMMPYQELLFPPGKKYSYSNPAFIYLARVIEQLTGDPWDAYVQKNIFAPLGMTESSFRSTPYYLAAHRSHNYTIARDSGSTHATLHENPTEFDPGITVPNGGWNAPLGDMATYMAFLMNADTPHRSRYDVVLSRASLEEMWRPVVPMADGYEASPDQAMGLSFFVRGTGTQRIIGHTGFQAGFRSFFYCRPSTTRCVVVVYNTTNEAAPANALADRVMREAIALLQH